MEKLQKEFQAATFLSSSQIEKLQSKVDHRATIKFLSRKQSAHNEAMPSPPLYHIQNLTRP